MKQVNDSIAWLLALVMLSGPASAALTIGLTDTFEDGTTNGWGTGLASPNPPVNVPGNGPGGLDDGYLLLTANGNAAPGGKLVAISGPQWAGDYVAAGVTRIQMDVNNLGNTDLSLRLYFEGTAGDGYSIDPVLVHAGSGWNPIAFPIRSGALTGNAAAVLAHVSQFRLYHSNLLTSPPGAPNIATQLGVDNIAAIPEPRLWLLMSAGLIAVLSYGPARRRQRFRS